MLKGYLNKELIIPELTATTKDGVIRELSGLIASHNKDLSLEVIASALTEREHLGSTGIEKGIAIPHARLDGLRHIVIAIARSKNGINFDSQDGGPTHLIFAMIAPKNAAGEHLKVLALLVKILGSRGMNKKLLDAKNSEEIYNTLVNVC